MVDVRTPPTVGIAAGIGFVIAVFAPYVALSSSGVAALETYYGYGLVAPTYLTLFALVGIVVLAAGREARTAPDLAAGVALVIGFAATLLTLLWATGVEESVVSSIGTETWLAYHRWVVLALGVVFTGTSVWYADVLGVLRG
ncbi:DUF7548 family protein [Haloarchaeobius iranensis]|uniref:Uncharacterized protein n=1 Tax=Haloarchaeobius iranensis TaxID=996166 RepID=A0A1G9WQG6_9EURY|nr:hypothetical protein [Haloarchaeobius iranensis]SDM86365.1 hypothetical protein SAMN05192554_108181 [Haloarchaeobius iranensis]